MPYDSHDKNLKILSWPVWPGPQSSLSGWPSALSSQVSLSFTAVHRVLVHQGEAVHAVPVAQLTLDTRQPMGVRAQGSVWHTIASTALSRYCDCKYMLLGLYASANLWDRACTELFPAFQKLSRLRSRWAGLLWMQCSFNSRGSQSKKTSDSFGQASKFSRSAHPQVWQEHGVEVGGAQLDPLSNIGSLIPKGLWSNPATSWETVRK